MREGKLFYFCNETRNIFDSICIAYSSFFIKFIITYIEGMHTIKTMGDLKVNLEKQFRQNYKNIIREYSSMKVQQITQKIQLMIDTNLSMKIENNQGKKVIQTSKEPIFSV